MRIKVVLAVLLLGCMPACADVLCGIDILERDHFKQLDGKRVAVVTNHSGRNRGGKTLVDLLADAPNLDIVRIFSPEHGLYGTVDQAVDDTTEPRTGLPVVSLYGKKRKPTTQSLADINTLVFDMQDVGARFYTFSATLGLCMEAAAEHNIKMFVLDRPNPITGLIVDGPIADKDKLGFTAFRPIPVAHGMTFGELATMYRDYFGIKCDLTVIKVEGWKRNMWFDETGLSWINPSPNMRNLTQALLYPGICLLEPSNVSVGRGTDQPFEYFGAPWIDAKKLASALNDQKLAGVRFIPMDFTPTVPGKAKVRFKDELCHGCYVIVTDRDAIQPVRVGVAITWQLHKLFSDKFEIDKVNKLLDSDKTLNAIKTATDPKTIAATWEDDVKDFKKAREKALLYP